jgi:PAS domain S-box-containing protein
MDANHAIVMSDPDGVICHWNSAAERLFGYSAADAIGRSLDLIVPPEFRERHWTGFRKAVSTATCKLDGAAINLPVLCKDGAVTVFPARFVFLRGARGEVIGFAGLYSDRAGSEAPFGPVVPM